MRVAVLDLGTNTFNLVVAEAGGANTFTILHNSKRGVKLGEGGINRGEIIPAAFQRGIEAIEHHYQTIQNLGVKKLQAFGTSALRTASNSSLFLKTIMNKTGIEVQIISGDREAELIYYGVRQTHTMDQEKHLILDIGGGSNEFIIADDQQLYWKKSYKLGIARLLEQFKPSDPITTEELVRVNDFIQERLTDLGEMVERHNITCLIGASGSFETFTAMIQANPNYESESALKAISQSISPAEFNALYQKLIVSTTAEREQMPGLEPMRIEMIVLAAVFVKFILDKFNIQQIIQSNFALKEGAIAEMLMAQ